MNLGRGLIAPLLTPFDDDGSLALDLLTSHARALLEEGCVGVAVFGTTGEGPSIGVDERRRALAALIDGGVPADAIVVGTGTASLADTIELTRHAASLGCAAGLVLPPFYFRTASQEGLRRYFLSVAAESDLPIILYHIPQVAGVAIPVSLAAELSEAAPTIEGIKDSSGDWSNTRALLQIPGLTVYPGSELPLLDALAVGAPGCISATANVNARSIASVIELWDAGAFEESAAVHTQVAGIRKTIQEYAPIPAQKELLARKFADGRWRHLRPPLTTMDPADTELLLAALGRRDGWQWERR